MNRKPVLQALSAHSFDDAAALRTVLLIEDSRFFQSAIRRELVRQVPAIELLVAGTLAEGLAFLEDRRSDIFCVLVDLQLPDASLGEAVFPIQNYGIPMVIFSGTSNDSLKEDLLTENVVDYVYKASTASLDYVGWIVRRLYRNAGQRVLVVDDSSVARKQMSAMLKLCRFQVLTAESGEAGLAMIEAGEQFTCVLTDHNMPGMTGFEFTTKLRERFGRDEMAIIGVSASGNAQLSAEFIKFGATDFLNKPFLREEFFCRVWQNIDLIENIRALEDAAYHDYLTGLANRRYFMDSGRKLVSAASRAGLSCVVALIDADHFKQVNDTYGHDVGDDVLRGVGGRLGGAFGREADLVARFGGEEFSVLLPDTETSAGESLLEKCRTLICETPIDTRIGPIEISISVGAISGSLDSLESALQRADTALYEAKERGRNKLVLKEC